MAEALNEEIYYFVVFYEDRYYPLFFSWILIDLIKDFKKLGDEQTHMHVQMAIPNHRFIANVNKPLYIFNIKADIQPHLGDDDFLDLSPPGSNPHSLPRFVPYPAYFKKSVECLFEYKLFNKLYQRDGGCWQEIII